MFLDQEYLGFEPGYKDSEFLKLLNQYPNLALLRSFSKLYSLAGLRIGFALCGGKVKDLLHYQDYYLGFSRILEEVAISALGAGRYYARIARKIIRDREWLGKKINKLKHFHSYRSHANFLFFKANGRAGALLRAQLVKENIITVKHIGGSFFRVSIGLTPHARRFASLLESIDKKV